MPLIPRFDEEVSPASFTASGRGFFLCEEKGSGGLFLYIANTMRSGCKDGFFPGTRVNLNAISLQRQSDETGLADRFFPEARLPQLYSAEAMRLAV